MSKIYSFNEFQKKYSTQNKLYMEEIHAALKTLSNFYDNIEGHMINLAVRDKWKEWNETMKNGDVFNFSSDMLANTGDKNVNTLFLLWENIYNTIEIISKENKIEFEGKTEGGKNAE